MWEKKFVLSSMVLFICSCAGDAVWKPDVQDREKDEEKRSEPIDRTGDPQSEEPDIKYDPSEPGGMLIQVVV